MSSVSEVTVKARTWSEPSGRAKNCLKFCFIVGSVEKKGYIHTRCLCCSHMHALNVCLVYCSVFFNPGHVFLLLCKLFMHMNVHIEKFRSFILLLLLSQLSQLFGWQEQEAKCTLSSECFVIKAEKDRQREWCESDLPAAKTTLWFCCYRRCHSKSIECIVITT